MGALRTVCVCVRARARAREREREMEEIGIRCQSFACAAYPWLDFPWKPSVSSHTHMWKPIFKLAHTYV